MLGDFLADPSPLATANRFAGFTGNFIASNPIAWACDPASFQVSEAKRLLREGWRGSAGLRIPTAAVHAGLVEEGQQP